MPTAIGSSRVEIKNNGLYAYNVAGEEQASLSANDGKLRIKADALVVQGTAVFDSINITGALTLNQDLTVGANVLRVNAAGSRVGINRAADPQFDLDVAGSVRWGGYGVGKMALQLAEALFIAHFDGPGDLDTDTRGSLEGHLGQKAAVNAAVSFGRGKYNKGVKLTAGALLHYGTAGNILPAKGTLSLWARPSAAATTGEPLFSLEASGTLTLWRSNAVGAELTANGDAVQSAALLPTGEWTHLVATWGDGSLKLYRNGVLVQTTAVTVVPFATDGRFYIGSHPGGYYFNGTIDDVAILGATADAALVRAIYESNAPVFAETSTWGFRTANTLAWADEEGLWAIDNAGNAAFGVSGVNGKSWGNIGTNIDKGDVVIGNNSNYVWWDASAGVVKFRGDGAGVTNINGGNIQTGTVTATKINVTSLSAVSGTFGGAVTLGANGGIWQGTGTFAAPTTGLKVWTDSGVGRLATYNEGVLQVGLDSDGAFVAGGGTFRADAARVSFRYPVGATGTTTPLRFYRQNGTTTMAAIQLGETDGSGFINSFELLAVAHPTTGRYRLAIGAFETYPDKAIITKPLVVYANGSGNSVLITSDSVNTNYIYAYADNGTNQAYFGAFGGGGTTARRLNIQPSGGNTQIGASGSGVGFMGATPVGRQTVTGSRGGNAALAALLIGLSNLGLITDSSTA